MSILVFDTETTILKKQIYGNPQTSEIPRLIQLSYTLFDKSNVELSHGNYVIKPIGFVITEEDVRIHGISQKLAETEGVSSITVLKYFLTLLDECEVIVAHNIEFDTLVIAHECQRLGLKFNLDEKRLICTMKNSTEFCKMGEYPNYKYPKLNELYYKLFNIYPESSHNAQSDVKTTSACFWELVKLGVINIDAPPSAPVSLLTYENMSNEHPRYKDFRVPKYSDSNDPVLQQMSNGDWGFFTYSGKWVSLSKYDIAGDFDNGISKVGKNGNWGLIDTDGKIVLEPQSEFNLIGEFNEGVAKIRSLRSPRVYGYINSYGKLVTPLVYQIAGEFSEGLAYVKYDKTDYGYIDKRGQLIIEPQFSQASNFNEGIAIVEKKGSKIFIDNKGNQISANHLDTTNIFINGFAKITKVDIQGDEDDIIDIFSDSYRATTYKYGFINIKGEEIISPIYDFVDNFNCNRALVENNQKFGFVDNSGTLVIELLYEDARSFSENLACVKIKGKYGFINLEGDLVIPAIYDEVGDFHEGFASVNRKKKYGFINKNGEMIIPLEYVRTNPYYDHQRFFKGIANVYKPVEEKKLQPGFINKLNKFMPSFNPVIREETTPIAYH